jgi:hypothetical protein
MWRRFGGAILAASAVLVSPCCLPITIPVALVALGGTAFGAWMITHEAVIVVVSTVYFFVVVALGAWWAMTRYSSPKVRSGLSLFRLFHPIGMADSTATEHVAPTCGAHSSCEAACCAPPIQVQRKIADS